MATSNFLIRLALISALYSISELLSSATRDFHGRLTHSLDQEPSEKQLDNNSFVTVQISTFPDFTDVDAKPFLQEKQDQIFNDSGQQASSFRENAKAVYQERMYSPNISHAIDGFKANEVKEMQELLTQVIKMFLPPEDRCPLSIFTGHPPGQSALMLKQALSGRPVKMYHMKRESLEAENTWARASCDGYIFFINHDSEAFFHHANVSHYHHSIHDSQPLSLWNYYAYYMIVLPSLQDTALVPSDILFLYNFQKTAKVAIFQPQNSYIAIWSHQLYKEGSGLRYLGSWNRGKFAGDLKHLFKTNLEDFESASLRVATFDHPPSVVYAHDEDHNIISRLGVDMQIIKLMAKAKNFTPKFLEVPHSELWGYELPNGTWNGLVGKVFYEHADIGACNVFLELHRWKMVDYSVPYNFERGCFVAPSPKPLLNWKSPVYPFAWDTWTFIAFSLLAGGLLLYVMVTLSRNSESREFSSFSYDYLYILGAMTMRSPNLVPSFTPVRLYIGFVWIFCLILSTGYSANLIAFMSVTQMSAPIDTIKELSSSGLRIGGVAFWKTQFTASIDPSVQKFSDVLESEFALSSLFDRVEAGDFALIENKQYLELQAGARYTYGSRTTIRIVRECLLPYSIGIAFQKNSPLKQVFDGVILRLFESGVVQKWKEEVVIYFRQQYKDKRQQKEAGEEEVLSRGKPLKLEQLQGAFYILGIGYLMAAGLMIVEILAYKI